MHGPSRLSIAASQLLHSRTGPQLQSCMGRVAWHTHAALLGYLPGSGIYVCMYVCVCVHRGICMVVTMLLYYALPLSTIGTIITTRNSASIYMPLAICAILNGTAW